MIWEPSAPPKSTILNRIGIEAYAGDIAITEDGDLDLENSDLRVTDPIEGFTFQVRNRVMTVTTNIFTAETQFEFDRESELLAEKLLSHTFHDHLIGRTFGLGHTIESIHGIERNDQKRTLSVKMSCTGISHLVSIATPYRNL